MYVWYLAFFIHSAAMIATVKSIIFKMAPILYILYFCHVAVLTNLHYCMVIYIWRYWYHIYLAKLQQSISKMVSRYPYSNK